MKLIPTKITGFACKKRRDYIKFTACNIPLESLICTQQIQLYQTAPEILTTTEENKK